VNTRPEDVPLPPALCVPVVAALRRPRPWQKSAPQVIFVGLLRPDQWERQWFYGHFHCGAKENEEMQVINKPPYW